MRLTAKEKIAYGLGAVGKDMVYMLSASYVLYYFQDLLGVSAIAMGVILMAARIFDAFNDPIMGVIVARTKTRWGKFRPWLMIGTLTNAVVLFLSRIIAYAVDNALGDRRRRGPSGQRRHLRSLQRHRPVRLCRPQVLFWHRLILFPHPFFVY